jgi:hypothetical protein
MAARKWSAEWLEARTAKQLVADRDYARGNAMHALGKNAFKWDRIVTRIEIEMERRADL